MSEATIEYKNSPNESTAYAVTEGQKTKVQLVATPAGDLELADNPNVDTGYLVINGEKHKCVLVAEVAGELKLPTSATDDTGYVTAQDGRQHKVKLVANITGGGDKTKFGVSIDNFLGDVDENGNYVRPSEPFELNLVGVKRVITTAFVNRVQHNTITKFIANDLIEVGANSFTGCFISSSQLIRVEVNNIETISGDYAFQQAFHSCNNLRTATFNKLKTVSGTSCFQSTFNNTLIKSLDNVFPSLEYVSGNNAFNGIITYAANDAITLSNIKKITGSTSQYSSIFGSLYVQNTVWNFPSATEFTGYIWNASSSYAGEIHFAAANQAAIEACDGYANKWGFAGATIYFDL